MVCLEGLGDRTGVTSTSTLSIPSSLPPLCRPNCDIFPSNVGVRSSRPDWRINRHHEGTNRTNRWLQILIRSVVTMHKKKQRCMHLEGRLCSRLMMQLGTQVFGMKGQLKMFGIQRTIHTLKGTYKAKFLLWRTIDHHLRLKSWLLVCIYIFPLVKK